MSQGVDTLLSFMVFLSMAIDKNAVIKEAQKYVAKGQFDKAIAEWKKLLRESPSDPNIYNTIGDLCLKRDAKADAVEAYKKAADILATDGFTSKAIALYKKVLNIDPKKIEVHLALGDLNAEKGLTGAAIESYKIVTDHYTLEKNMVMALGVYQKMADLNPSNITFRIKLGDMYAKEKMRAEAAKAYLDAADSHVSKEAFQDARQLFEKVLSLDPNNKEVYYKAGVVYFKEGKFVEACKALKPAFEGDPFNRDISETYLEALIRAGKPAEAEEVLKKIIVEDSSSTDLREKLYNLYLSNKKFEMALVEASVLARWKTEKGDVDAAEELLKAFVSESPQFAPGRQKLAEFYASINRDGDAAIEFHQAAELLAKEGDREGAKTLLARALEIVPGMPEARKQLERLEASAIAPPSIKSELTIPESAPIVERSIAPAPAAAFETLVPASSAAPLAAEEDPVLNDAFIEADVLIKYGLSAKASEHLEGLTVKYPENSRLRVKLRDLYREHGNIQKAVLHSLLLSDIYSKLGMVDMAEAALQTAAEMAPDSPAVLSKFGKAPATAAPAEIHVSEIIPEHLASGPVVTEIAPSAFEEELPVLEPALARDGTITFEGLDTQLPPLDEEAFSEGAPALEVPETEQQPAEEAPVIMEQPSTPEVPEERAAEVDLIEIWAEAEFYYQQGLFDEAKKHYAKIIGISPSDRRAIDRLAEISREEDDTREFTKLAEAVEGLEDAVPSEDSEGELATSASDEEAVRRLMEEIAEIHKEQKPQPAPPREVVPPQEPQPVQAAEVVGSSTASVKMPAEEDFFNFGAELQDEVTTSMQEQEKKSEDFFDLAAELRDELSTTAVAAVTTRPSKPPEEQSLDDIFQEFKKGVEQQAVKEDTDTHYNLGVAYKEMGLLEDAIAEFIMTHEGEPWFVQSRHMLGLCYMEMGEYQNAASEIQNALNYAMSMGIDNQSRIGMQYDLGLAYQGSGNIKASIIEFQQVSDVNPRYRDTAAKLKELRRGDFISLEQLKDDIEKEISSKFLEEGERIEREEKSRRSDKMRN